MGEGERVEGSEEEEEEEEDACRRPQKRRKLLKGPQPCISRHPSQASEQIGSSPNSSDIKVSSRSHSFYVQDVQTGSSSKTSHGMFPLDIHAHSQSTSAHTHITVFGTPPSDASQAHAQLQDTKSVAHTHIRGLQCESLPSTHTQIKCPRGVSGLSQTPTQIKSPRGEGALSSTHTEIKVLSCSRAMLPPHKSYPSRAHHLPHDLIISNIVASRLPLINLIRARTVCRAWRDSIFSPVIAKSFHANADCQRPRLVIEHSSPLGPCLAVFDAFMHDWSVIPTPSFGRLVAASSGLFCYVTEAGRPPSLVVGNPLTNQWKHLPAIPLSVPAHGPQIVGMVANSSAGSYKVIVLFGMWDDDASDAYLPFMYDSTSERWTHRNTVSARLSFATSRTVMKAPDILLSVDSSAGNLLSYDITNNVGHTTQLKHLPLFINEEDQKTNLWRRLPQVAICEGELFLVARCIGERAPECKLGQLPIVQHSSVGVWMMHTNSGDWQFITRVPLELLEKLVEGSDGTDFIIASNSGSTLFFVLKGSSHMLAYDSTLYSWTVLPGCPADFNSYPLHQSAFYEPLLWVSAM